MRPRATHHSCVQVATITQVLPGQFRIVYRVIGSASLLPSISVQVSVAGLVLAPRRVANQGIGCRAAGVHVATIAVADEPKYGLAINASGSLMAVTGYKSNTITIHDRVTGKAIRTLCGRGAAVAGCEFTTPGQICFTPNGNLLVADPCGGCVREVTVFGDDVRSIAVSGAWAVACNEDIIVVGCSVADPVQVFDALSGKLLIAMGQFSKPPAHAHTHARFRSTCESVCLSLCGAFIWAMDHYGKLLKFTLRGELLLSALVPVTQHGHHCIAVGAGNTLLVSDPSGQRVLVLSADDARVLRQVGSRAATEGVGDAVPAPHYFTSPSAIAVHGTHMFVLDVKAPRVQVFE